MKILILGGTRFVGKKLSANLIKSGHELEILSRSIPEVRGNKPKYFTADRKNETSLKEILLGKKFDCVIDMINFSSKDSEVLESLLKNEVFSTSHYVCISTAYTYLPKGGVNLDEKEFNASTYNVRVIDRPEVSYDEGKRLCEAYMTQRAPWLKCAFIRFPIIFGSDDYTSRFFYFLNELLKGNDLTVYDNKKEMSYIDSDEAAKFIQWIAENKKIGFFNAACEGSISEFDYAIYQKELCSFPNSVFPSTTMQDQSSPMFTSTGLTLNCDLAKKEGYNFSNLKDRIKYHTLKYIQDKKKN